MLELLIAVPCIVVLFVAASWNAERKAWNRGICRATGRPWVLFDHDSTGARGYSDGGKNVCWISWPIDAGIGAASKGGGKP